jgi:hypothetical protein
LICELFGTSCQAEYRSAGERPVARPLRITAHGSG